VKDTPRQDVLPALSTGLIFSSPGAGTLFPQPRLQSGLLMDEVHGYPWRWITDGTLKFNAPQGVKTIDMAMAPEAEGVVANWMQRHGVHAALVRPDQYVFATATNASDAQNLFANWQAHLESID
jgi:3-(3-hydroxy-phenyl)propionate hydroxylase